MMFSGTPSTSAAVVVDVAEDALDGVKEGECERGVCGHAANQTALSYSSIHQSTISKFDQIQMLLLRLPDSKSHHNIKLVARPHKLSQCMQIAAEARVSLRHARTVTSLCLVSSSSSWCGLPKRPLSPRRRSDMTALMPPCVHVCCYELGHSGDIEEVSRMVLS